MWPWDTKSSDEKTDPPQGDFEQWAIGLIRRGGWILFTRQGWRLVENLQNAPHHV